jgi:DNA primase
LYQLKIPKEEAKDILKYLPKGQVYNLELSTSVQLPKEFQLLSNATPTSFVGNIIKKYLYERGFTDNDFIKYSIGYCTSGEYGGRVIIPSYNASNQLNFFVARTYDGNYFKYKNPEASKDIVIFENLINWNTPIIICEGVFDAIAIKRNAVPILGKSISNALMKKLIQSKAEEIYIALDKDAQSKAFQYSEQFLSMGKKVFLVKMEEKDPSEMGFKNFTKHIQTAEQLDLQTIMQYKLGL